MNHPRLEGVFRDFRPLNDLTVKNHPALVPLKFKGGSFELIKKIENFFHRKFDRKWAGNIKICSADRTNMSKDNMYMLSAFALS